MKTQVKPNHYFKPSYDSKERFVSYWHQINELIKFRQLSIVELGIGNGFVSDYLKKRGYNITTLDIDPRLNPDVAASVTNIPFADDSFDVVACYEVLEHLPYENFKKAIREIFRISNSYAVLSLPDASRVYRLYAQIPKIGEFKKLIPMPTFRKSSYHFNGQHYWEIGKAECTLNRIVNDLTNVGFKISKTYRPFENPYHRFFILEKNK